MKPIQQKPSFIINSACDPSINSILNISAFELLLNTHLALKAYGTGIEQLLFTFIAQPNDAPIKWEEEKNYIEVNRLLKMSLKINFRHLSNAKGELAKEMMARLFLNSIALYADLEIDDFDWQVFYIDAKTLFVQEKWLAPSFSHEKQFILDFGIGGGDWLVIGKKMSHFYQLERVLNQNLQLSEYGIGVHRIECAFVILPERSILSCPIVNEYLFGKKRVKIIIELSYDELLNADEYTLFQLLSSYVLKVLTQIAELQVMDFDWKRLYRHLRWLLIVENWMDEPLTLQEKASITGLPNSLIKRIESNADTVRIGALKIYCEKLKIPYEEVVPELFLVA